MQFIEVLTSGGIAEVALNRPKVNAMNHAVLREMTDVFRRLAEDDAELGLPELAVGIPFPRVAFEIVRAACPTRAFRRLVFGADLHSPAEIFEMGVGDALSADPLEDARRWLTKACGRPAAAFRFVKASHRNEAWARIAATPAAEREALIDALVSAKQALTAPLVG